MCVCACSRMSMVVYPQLALQNILLRFNKKPHFFFLFLYFVSNSQCLLFSPSTH